MWYIIKKKAIEPLLSGCTAEQLGIIKFAQSPLTSSDMKYINAINTTTTTNDSTKRCYIQKYPEALNGVGTLKDYEVTLYLDANIKPLAEPPRTIPFDLQKHFSNEIKQMEKQGIMEPHTGPAPWISSVVLSPKADGNIRVTVDMRQVNKEIKSTNFPIPKVEDIKAKMAGNKVFSKLDFRSAFHQLHLSEESRYAIVFHGDSRLMRFCRLTIENMVAFGELNKAFIPIFSNIDHSHIIHDDLIIVIPTVEEHDRALEIVLNRIMEVGLTLVQRNVSSS